MAPWKPAREQHPPPHGGVRRLLLVLGTSTGGVGRHVRAVVRAAVAEGLTVTVAGPRATEEAFRFSEAGARFAALEIAAGARAQARHPLSSVAMVGVLRQLAAGHDVVHAHGIRAGAVAAAAHGAAPLVVTWHNAPLSRPSAAARIGLARVARAAAVSLCVSPDLVAQVFTLGGRAQLAPVGADELPPPSRSAGEVRSELGAGDRPLVVAVGRLHQQKGFDVLAEASRLLASDALVVVAGDGPERASLAALAGERLRLLGPRTDVADLLHAADLVVMPSRWEGSPLAAHEALQAGRPMVATPVGGLPALLGDAAAWTPVGDAAALAATIDRLLADPVLRHRLAAAAPAALQGWPGAEAAARGVMAVYRRLV